MPSQDSIYAAAGDQFDAFLEGADADLVGVLTVAILDTNDNVVTPATTAGISEFAGGVYKAELVAPAEGDYVILWENTGGDDAIELLTVNDTGSPPPFAEGIGEPYYTTVDNVREKVGVPAMSVDDATALVVDAERIIDRIAGALTVITNTGRKYNPAGLPLWRASRLSEATLEIVAVLHAEPTAFQPVRFASVSGPDFSYSNPVGGGLQPAAQAALRAAADLLDAGSLRALSGHVT